jgi:hypothetical protein
MSIPLIEKYLLKTIISETIPNFFSFYIFQLTAVGLSTACGRLWATVLWVRSTATRLRSIRIQFRRSSTSSTFSGPTFTRMLVKTISGNTNGINILLDNISYIHFFDQTSKPTIKHFISINKRSLLDFFLFLRIYLNRNVIIGTLFNLKFYNFVSNFSSGRNTEPVQCSWNHSAPSWNISQKVKNQICLKKNPFFPQTSSQLLFRNQRQNPFSAK